MQTCDECRRESDELVEVKITLYKKDDDYEKDGEVRKKDLMCPECVGKFMDGLSSAMRKEEK